MSEQRTHSSQPDHPTESIRKPASPPPPLRTESRAIYIALAAGGFGAVIGVILAVTLPPLPLSGDWSFGSIVGIAAGVISAVVAGAGYWRARTLEGQEWRHSLSPTRFSINMIAVVLVHAVLCVLAVLVIFLTLSLGFIGLEVEPLWAATLMAVALGLSAYFTYLSVSQMTTQRMSTLLMSFVVIGTLTAMVTSPDERWWEANFSQLGTFWSVSSLIFNGTLVVGGLLVTTFAVYLANDMHALTIRGVLSFDKSPKVIALMFIVMGAMLAGVGLVPVNINLFIHNLCASGMALMFLGMFGIGPRVLRGMPRAYFIAVWVFVGALVLSSVLFAVGYFGLTAFEIVVFALIFGWISVFIRFLGVAGGETPANAPSNSTASVNHSA